MATSLTALSLGWAGPAAPADPITVIANPAAPIESLSHTSLRAIFSMRLRQWPGDGPVTVYVLPDRDTTHVSFSKQILRIYPYVLRETWDRLVFTGTGTAPIEAKTQDDLLRLVSNTPGAIGYIENGQPPGGKVKVIEIR
jgi:ABC-type phosphate transport system substrate-binding protein